MKKGLAVGIIIMFIIITVTPVVFGYNQQITVKNDMDKLLQDLYYDSMRYGGYSNFESYKDKLLEEVNLNLDSIEDDYINFASNKNYKTSLNNPIGSLLNSGGPMNSSWPMKCRDTHHTGKSPYSTAQVDGLEKWRFYATNWIDGGAVIDSNGVLYFGEWGMVDNFFAVYLNGTLKWNFDTDNIIWSTPAIAEDGTIYIGSYGGFLYAINPDGSERWRFLAGDSISSSPAIAEDGAIYFGTMWGLGSGGKIFAVNPDGTEKWRYQTGYHIVSDPAIGDDGTIYIGSGDTYFYAMNPNGTLKWRFKTGDIIKSHASIAEDGTIYFSSFDGNTYALNPDGTEKWRFGNPGSGANSAVIASDGTIYVTGDKLFALYPENGNIKWDYSFGDNRFVGHSSPAISSDGTIYIGVIHGIPNMDYSGGEIHVVNPDGTFKWSKVISVDNWVDSSPCIGSDGTVYIGSAYYKSRGFLHAFGPVESNSPPETPYISGDDFGRIGASLIHQFITVDPDNNPISFYIDWGDGDEGWSIEWGSGEDLGLNHIYSEAGSYTIRAKAKDVLGEESDWYHFNLEIARSRFVLLWGELCNYTSMPRWGDVRINAVDLKIFQFFPPKFIEFNSGETVYVDKRGKIFDSEKALGLFKIYSQFL